MAAILHTLDQRRLIDSNGIADGSSIYFYLTGTTTPAAIYSDDTLTTPLANPVVVNAGAAVPNIYLDSTVTYRRLIVYDDGGTDDADPYTTPYATQAAVDLKVATATLAASGGAALVGTTTGTVQTAIDGLPSDDRVRHFYGREYLGTFRKLLTAGGGANITLSGDSTTAGTATTAGYEPDILLRSMAHDRGADYQVITNRGQSGKDTADWVADHLAGDIAATANLYIFRWGVNDADTALKSLTVAQGLANWETALQTFRAAKPLSVASCLIMAPNASIGRGRTKEYFEAYSEGLRELARQYGCAFFDTFNFARDALENSTLSWDDSLGGLTSAIHPLDALNGAIYGVVADELFSGLGPRKSNHLWNRRQVATVQTLAAATLPDVFEYGLTIDRALAAQGFPADGFVVTFKSIESDQNALQMLWSNGGAQFRIGGASWLGWVALSGGEADIDPGTGFVKPGSLQGYAISGAGLVTLDGYISASGATALLTANQQIATIPAGYRPRSQQWGVDLHIFDSNKTPLFETIKGVITTAGVFTTRTASTYNAERIYFDGTYPL